MPLRPVSYSIAVTSAFLVVPSRFIFVTMCCTSFAFLVGTYMALKRGYIKQNVVEYLTKIGGRVCT